VRITVLAGPLLPVPALRGGAMQKIWHGLAREFASAGHSVTVVARAFPGQPPTETLEGVRFLRHGGFSQSAHVACDLARDLVDAVQLLPRLPAADILVTNDFWAPALAATFRSSAGAVVISAGRFPKGQYGLYRGAARIVAISSAVRDAIAAEQPRLEGRTVVVPLPVDLDRFVPRRSSTRGDRPTLLYVGRIHPEKGIDLLIRSFGRVSKDYPEWRLVLVGPTRDSEGGGGKRFAAAMRDLSSKLEIEWRDPIWDPAKLAALYSSPDLFCYPSLAEKGEAFGVAALESMAAGIPPVVSDLACFRDFVRHGENGWVFDHQGQGAEVALADALAKAMGDSEGRERLGRQARETAEGFGFETIAKGYLVEFERILSER
jgi:glycosyltransferase involved in cell wall biosynthesis